MFSAWDPSTPTLGAPGGERAELGPSGFVRSPFSRPSGAKWGGIRSPPVLPRLRDPFPESLRDSLGTRVHPLALSVCVG